MNLQKVVGAVACSLVLVSARAQESDWARAFDTMWETRWQESGVLMDAIRWPNSESRNLKYSISANATNANAENARAAIANITAAMGFSATEIPEGSSEVQIQFELRKFDDFELQQAACFAQRSTNNGVISKARIVMSEQYAYRCVLHELMHAMGFPGHPSGDSVLSYFEGNRLSLKPIDKFLLKAWHTDAIQPEMRAFTVSRTLNRLWIDQNVPDAERTRAREFEERWFKSTVASLEAYAFGKGEPPKILYRSGRLSPAGMQVGLIGAQITLADAYFDGLAGEPNVEKSAQLWLLAAKLKSRFAANEIAFRLFAGSIPHLVAKPLCEWLRSTTSSESGISSARLRSALNSDACLAKE